MPFLILSYLLAYMDRANVGIAKLQMESDLGFSNATIWPCRGSAMPVAGIDPMAVLM